MQEFLLYRPNKTEIIIPFIMFPLAIVMFSFAFLIYGTLEMYFCLVFGAFLLYYGFNNYHISYKIIAFGQNEIQVFNRKLLQRYLWTDFSEVYYAKNFKNQLYLVMSGEELNEKQLKHLCAHGASKRLKNVLLFYISDATLDEREIILNEIKKHEINIHK